MEEHKFNTKKTFFQIYTQYNTKYEAHVVQIKTHSNRHVMK